MVDRLLSFERPEEARVDLPEFPTVNNCKLGDFFKILRVEADWLTWPLDKFEESEDYRKAQQFMTTVKVVNDAAEREIKLA